MDSEEVIRRVSKHNQSKKCECNLLWLLVKWDRDFISNNEEDQIPSFAQNAPHKCREWQRKPSLTVDLIQNQVMRLSSCHSDNKFTLILSKQAMVSKRSTVHNNILLSYRLSRIQMAAIRIASWTCIIRKTTVVQMGSKLTTLYIILWLLNLRLWRWAILRRLHKVALCKRHASLRSLTEGWKSYSGHSSPHRWLPRTLARTIRVQIFLYSLAILLEIQ